MIFGLQSSVNMLNFSFKLTFLINQILFCCWSRGSPSGLERSSAFFSCCCNLYHLRNLQSQCAYMHLVLTLPYFDRKWSTASLSPMYLRDLSRTFRYRVSVGLSISCLK